MQIKDKRINKILRLFSTVERHIMKTQNFLQIILLAIKDLSLSIVFHFKE